MAKQTSIRKTEDIRVNDGQVSKVKKETTVTKKTNNQNSGQLRKKPKKQSTETVTIEIDHEE